MARTRPLTQVAVLWNPPSTWTISPVVFGNQSLSNATQDLALSLTKVAGHHTLKTGFFNTHSYKAEQATGADSFGTLNFQQDTPGTNAFDTSFGFANAAIGSFSGRITSSL